MKLKHLLSFAFIAIPFMASAQITIDETNFPDENFRNYLREQSYGEDGIITDEEIKNITYISVSNKNISSLKGIEYFTALKNLFCYSNQLTTLDVSNNTALTYLECYSNPLTTLDVSKNTALTYLSCGANQLTTLDVSKNTALTYLECWNNQLTSLDVSKNTALTNLECGYNQLTTFDVSNNMSLTYLKCYSNQLLSLDVSKNTALTSLHCGYNQLTTLDVSKNTALTDLDCGGNQLTTLDVSNNTALEILYCFGNQLTSLDVSNNTKLETLYCHQNQLLSLDVSNNTALTYLNCFLNELASLDVSNCTALTDLKCYSNQLASLDVSNCTALTDLKCYSNQIKGISMNALISSLPANPNKGIEFDDSGTGNGHLNDGYADGEASSDRYKLYIYDNGDGNICTRNQVAAIKAKGWTVYKFYEDEYEGCDDPTSITVSVNSDGLSTYCPVFDVDFSGATEIAAYTATISGNTVYLERVASVAAGEGVLLRSLNGGEATEELPIDEAEKHEDNAFVGTLEAIVLKEKVDNVTNFILGRNSGVLGFYKANDTRLSAWEAYLPVENYNPSKPLRVVFSDVTDINEIIAQPTTDDDAFYTLSGIRVTNPTKGIYIKNGKKVMVK